MKKERVRVGRKRSEESRAAILDAALTLLREDGYGKLTFDRIAETSGAGKQTIYRWWKTKGDIVLDALIEHARTITTPELGSLERDLAAFLDASFRLLRGASGTGPLLKALMAEAQSDADFAERFSIFIAARRAVLRDLILRHAKTDRDSVEALVDMLFGTLWYRLLVGHAPLDGTTARILAKLASRAAAAK